MDVRKSRHLINLVKKCFDILDIPVIYLSLYIAWWLRFESTWFEVTNGIPAYAPYHRTFCGISLLWFIIFTLTGLYKNRLRFGVEQIFTIVRTIFVAAAAVLAGAFFYREFTYSRLTLVLGLCSTTVCVSAFHMLKRQLKLFLQSRGYGLEKVLIVGSGDLGIDCYKRLHTEVSLLGLELAGLCGDEETPSRDKSLEIPILGKLSDLTNIIEEKAITQTYIALEPEKQKKTLELLTRLNGYCIDIKIVPNVYSIITSSIHISNIGGMPVVNLMPLSIHGTGGYIKTIFDKVGAFFGLLFLSPFLALVALKIKRDSPGDIIYRQERVGRDGKSFTIYKFRSMRIDAEVETGPVWQ